MYIRLTQSELLLQAKTVFRKRFNTFVLQTFRPFPKQSLEFSRFTQLSVSALFTASLLHISMKHADVL
jgi:hypothetical protein